jgi:hypothetical protein
MLDRLLHHGHILKCGPLEDQVADRPFGAGKAMTRTIGDLEKTRLRTSECGFFRALGKKTRFTLLGEFMIGYNL